jgi:glycosyltransferase, family 2
MTPIISIIVPVYNVHNYLHNTLNSILVNINHCSGEVEVILIDDASSDSSTEILHEFQQKNPTLKTIFLQKNTGVSNVRNQGASIATGEWLWFSDADDIIIPGAISYLIKQTKVDPEADIIHFQTMRGCTCKADELPMISGNHITPECWDVRTHSGAINAVRNGIGSFIGWNCLYRRALLTKVQFAPNLKNGEDILFGTVAISYARKILITRQYCYYYVERATSAVSNMNLKRYYDTIDSAKLMYNALVIWNMFPRIKHLFYRKLITHSCGIGMSILQQLSREDRRRGMDYFFTHMRVPILDSCGLFESLFLYPVFIFQNRFLYYILLYFPWILRANILKFKLFNRIWHKIR